MSTIQDRTVLGPSLAGTLMAPEEFDAVEEWDELYVYELINGVLIVTPPPSEGERGPNDLLGRLLWDYQQEHPEGSAMNYTLWEHTVVTRKNRRRADRVIWAGLGRVPNVRSDLPTIVVEFVSVDRRDRIRDYEVKREEYREIAIAEYWIIDRYRRLMTVVRQPSEDPPELIVRENEIYTTSLLPGFELPLARLFAEADMLERAQEDSREGEAPAEP